MVHSEEVCWPCVINASLYGARANTHSLDSDGSTVQARANRAAHKATINTKLLIIYDENEDTLYYKHSWNKFNDIHFDISWGTIDWGLLQQQGWREYIELPNTPKPTKELNKKIITMLDCKSWLEGCKNWVLNRGVLNDWVFEIVGGEEGYVTDFVIPFDESEIKKHQMKLS